MLQITIEQEFRSVDVLERKEKEFSRASVATPARSSNQLKPNEICGSSLDSDVHSSLWLSVQNRFQGENFSS